MPYPLPSDVEDLIAAGKLVPVRLVDLYLADALGDPLTLRAWNQIGTLTYPANDTVDGTDDVTYSDMYGRMEPDRELRFTASLEVQPLKITLDGSRLGDDEDWTGQFADADWHQRKVRVREVLLNPDDSSAASAPHWDWRGRLDERPVSYLNGDAIKMVISCQGGMFRIRGRRLHTRTDANQRRRKATDRFFAPTPGMIAVPPIWAKARANIPGVSPNFSAGSGGTGGMTTAGIIAHSRNND